MRFASFTIEGDVMSKKKSSRKKRDLDFLQESLRRNGKAHDDGPKRKKWSKHDLKSIKPLTPAQTDLFHAFMNSDQVEVILNFS